MLIADEFITENSIKLGVALLLGALMGAEREYKGRNIGFRTIILVTVGSTLFTIISLVLGEGTDPTRVASNVVTGVGFLGAGAIFRDGFSVKGVTTASLIWVSAAIGMSCGIGLFQFAIYVTIIVLLVLIGFTGMQKFIDRYNKEVVYNITIANSLEVKKQIEDAVIEHGLSFEIIGHQKLDQQLILLFEIRGSIIKHNKLLDYLATESHILAFRT